MKNLPDYATLASPSRLATLEANKLGASLYDRKGSFPILANGQTTRQTTINMTNTMVGAGLLALPYGVKQGGVVIIPCILFFALYVGFTLWMIGDMLKKVDSTPEAKELARKDRGWHLLSTLAFGSSGGIIVEGIFLAECYGMFFSYIILSGYGLTMVVPSLGMSTHICFCGAIAACLTFVPLKHLTHFGILGMALQILVVILLILTGVQLAMNNDIATTKEVVMVKPNGVAGALGMVIFIFNAHCAAPMFYQAMEDRSKWSGSVAWTMAASSTLFMFVGSGAYLFFGEACQETVIDNLGRGTNLAVLSHPLPHYFNSICGPLCGGIVGMKQLAALPNYLMPFLNSLEATFEIRPYPLVVAIWRVALVGVSTYFAVAVGDKLASVMELVGSITNNMICIGLPTLLYLKLHWRTCGWPARLGLGAACCLSLLQAILGGGSALYNILFGTGH